MARRYKLVPESLYQRLVKPAEDEEHEETLEDKRDAILRQNIPDDLKVLLYSNAARDLSLKKIKRREKPLMVKNVESKETPSTDTSAASTPGLASLLNNNKKALDLDQFLKTNSITHNEKMELVVNGAAIPNTNYAMVIKGIQNHYVGFQPGMNQVLNALKSIPDGLYSKAVIAKYMPTLLPIPSFSKASSSTPPPTASRKKVITSKRRNTTWHSFK
ncbi:unnamed protein product [Orchesella dallaii]|uniref:Uncharacterized protein n=1 Tax=Orchesella dallaii TaxID=48710 RepID=A0ABP1Q7M0_9HEXA